MLDEKGTKFKGKVGVKFGDKSYTAKTTVVKPEGTDRTEVYVNVGGFSVCVPLPKGEEIAKKIGEQSRRIAVLGVKKVRNGLDELLKTLEEPAPKVSQTPETSADSQADD